MFTERCGRCHAIDVPLSRHRTEVEWTRTVWAMRQRGADLDEREAQIVVRYLARVRGEE